MKKLFSCRCEFRLFILGGVLQDPSSGGKAGFATAGECRGRRSGEKTWDHFGKIYSGKEISYSDRGNGCFCKGKMSGPGSGAAQL